jgi:hypothetical protein
MQDNRGTEVLPLEDRARLAFEELVLVAEREEWTPIRTGQVILAHAVDESEIITITDYCSRKMDLYSARRQPGF